MTGMVTASKLDFFRGATIRPRPTIRGHNKGQLFESHGHHLLADIFIFEVSDRSRDGPRSKFTAVRLPAHLHESLSWVQAILSCKEGHSLRLFPAREIFPSALFFFDSLAVKAAPRSTAVRLTAKCPKFVSWGHRQPNYAKMGTRLIRLSFLERAISLSPLSAAV